MLPSIIESLDPEQRAAALHERGPALVRAGPGAGKTRVLTAHAAVLIARGVPPERIIAITFTRKAATTLQERLRPLLPDGAKPVSSSTIHSLCLKLIRRHAHRIQLDTHFSIYDAEDSGRVLSRVLEELRPGEAADLLSAMRGQISSLKSHLITPRRLAHRITQGYHDVLGLLPVYEAYQRVLEEEHALDFDDLLLVAVRLLSTEPDILAAEQQRADAILTDEIQDICYAEARLLALLAGSHRHLFGIGDRRQSIYGFRDALPDAFGQIRHWFPEAVTYQLNRNYRSTATIVAAGQAIIEGGEVDPEDGQLWTTNEAGAPVSWHRYGDQDAEAAHLAHQIVAHVQAGGKWRDWAILIRVHVLARALELALHYARIPFRLVGDIAFATRAEVKDLLAYVRLAVNPHDVEAFQRAVQVPSRGVGEVTIRQVVALARARNHSLLQAAQELIDTGPGGRLRQQTRDGLAELLMLITVLRQQSVRVGVAAALQDLADRIKYRDYLQERYGKVKGAGRYRTVQDLISLAHDLPATPPADRLGALLDDLVGSPDAPTGEADDVVSILTIHAAKGLEWPCVAVVGVEDGLLPIGHAMGQDQEEEERRLFYVAATRAAERLLITTVDRRLLNDRVMRLAPSPLLDDLPPEQLVVERPALDGVRRRTIFRPRRLAS